MTPPKDVLTERLPEAIRNPEQPCGQGKCAPFDTNSQDLWEPVGGDASLRGESRKGHGRCRLHDFEGGHGDMSWRSLGIRSGAFGHTQGTNTIEGAFYGSDHQGAAGKFRRDRLQGVFGAVCN